MKLFTVTQTEELVVLARDEEHAKHIAKNSRSEVPPDQEVGLFVGYPADWDADCYPFGSDGQQTIGEWLTANGQEGKP